MPVTTRITTFLLANLYKPLFATAGWGVDPADPPKSLLERSADPLPETWLAGKSPFLIIGDTSPFMVVFPLVFLAFRGGV